MGIDTIIEHAKRIASGSGKLGPGEAFRINEACTPGDRVWQGDVSISIVDDVVCPPGFIRCDAALQLAPGSTIGSRHVIADPTTIAEFCKPSVSDRDSLVGPRFLCVRDTTITHPTHGDVSIAAGHRVQIHYQRNWDAEQQEAHRSRD